MKRLDGNPGNRPIFEAPVVSGDFPSPPDWLDDMALGEWNRLAPILDGMGIITGADRVAIAAYCQAYSLYVNATRDLSANGFSAEGRQGSIVKNPALQAQIAAQDQMAKWGAKLGLSPSDRARLAVTPDDDSGPDADVLRLLS
ncbi:phage terminase small subunit P27 family [Kitasatospora sp. MBT66]|uniref:phage terminase small subunit P27 family n=1 Tax=Kitasatospora sp. MBT66 TaxID=1444769 RepID=UPI0011EA605D|nr:phage terminase small subunit P27 family [Kitasatospora sp. MBT66]